MIVSVIIPAWNLWGSTFACLQSLAKYNDGRMEVVVVDNGSTDDTYLHLQHIGREFFGNRFIRVRHEENLGFAIASNAGAVASHGDILFFLNNDTTVTENWLTPLVDTLAQPNIAAVGPLLLYPDGTCQHCGIGFTPLMKPCHLYANFPGNHPAVHSQHSLQAITGAALMVGRQDFFRAGTFHVGYRNGFEDMDLCCSLRQQGGKLAIAPKSVIIHAESKTPGRHKDESHNAQLFTECWGETIRPDMHKLVAIDGYNIRISPNFSTYAIASDVKIEALNVQPNPTIEYLGQLLKKEPLWLGGYIQLVEKMEKKGQYEQALDVATHAMRFFPLEPILRMVFRCAKRIQRQDIATATTALLRSNTANKANRQTALYMQKLAYQWNDGTLAEIFTRWLAECA